MPSAPETTGLCPFCLGDGRGATLTVRELTQSTMTPFHYVQCPGCGSYRCEDFPAAIAAWYKGYFSFSDLDQPWADSRLQRFLVQLFGWCVVRTNLCRALRPLFRNPTAAVMDRISPNLQAFLFLGAAPGARILDVGAGVGALVKQMARIGFPHGQGIDPFLDPSQENRYSRRSDIHSVEGTWDIILFNHSLEHMRDPESALARCKTLLAAGGSILVQVPNVPCAYLDRFQGDWAWFHAPYHFALPSQAGMEALARRCGFKVADRVGTSRWDHYLYHDEYRRGIGNQDPGSVRRQIERGAFSKRDRLELLREARGLNRELRGDWIGYRLVHA